MLRCCIEPPAGHILPSIGSYVGITLEIRTAVFMWQYFLLLQKLVNDFLFPASKQVKEARDHPGGLSWFVYITVLVKHTNSMHGMPFCI